MAEVEWEQLVLTCEQCDGQRVIKSDDTPTEVCDFCDGSGIDPNALYMQIVVRGFYQEKRFSSDASPGGRRR